MLCAGKGCNLDVWCCVHREANLSELQIGVTQHSLVSMCFLWGVLSLFSNILTQFNLPACIEVQDVCGSQKKKPLVARILLLVLLISSLAVSHSSLVIQELVSFLVPLLPPRQQVRQRCLIPTTPTSPPLSPFPSSPSAATSWPQSGTEPALLSGWGEGTLAGTDSDRRLKGDRGSLVWSASLTPNPQP